MSNYAPNNQTNVADLHNIIIVLNQVLLSDDEFDVSEVSRASPNKNLRRVDPNTCSYPASYGKGSMSIRL